MFFLCLYVFSPGTPALSYIPNKVKVKLYFICTIIHSEILKYKQKIKFEQVKNESAEVQYYCAMYGEISHCIYS